jgi:hypothetical protein
MDMPFANVHERKSFFGLKRAETRYGYLYAVAEKRASMRFWR